MQFLRREESREIIEGVSQGPEDLYDRIETWWKYQSDHVSDLEEEFSAEKEKDGFILYGDRLNARLEENPGEGYEYSIEKNITGRIRTYRRELEDTDRDRFLREIPRLLE